MILQLNPTIAVQCKDHQEGEALFVIDYGLNINSVWIVRLAGGQIKHFYSDDILVYDNPMNGKGYDLKELPEQVPERITSPSITYEVDHRD